ncbi:uncharacterized protein FIESC28_03448 [Fusarium coffeatum]|uniref:Uncharacterized protein n=1 Tax=Fusarium coffeatum TaxID=231269 RepID=A0A366S352_9HYPO|nr:uncharacterized protein FIESC28_03448 [Fusarium coffeatum]RBR23743.1 hypothetical protein FIESC28_03448 [Fusarium coffeatum]
MDEAFVAQSPQRVIPLQQWIEGWSACTALEKSPNEILQYEHQQAKAELDDAYERFKSQGTQDSSDEVHRCMQRCIALAHPDESTRKAKERDYQQSWVLFYKTLFDILDNPAAIKAVLDKFRERASTQHSSHHESTRNQCQTTAFPVSNSPDTQHSSRSQNPRIEPVPTTHRTHSQGELSINDQRAEGEARGRTTRSKTHTASTASPAPHWEKRSRQAPSEAAPTTTETIEFREVYQDGQAEPKYTIIEYERLYYIVRCKEHGLAFSGEHPLQGAMNHLRVPGHQVEGINYSLAISKLGALVLNCDEDDKEKNNRVVRRHVEQMEDQRRRRCRASQAYRDLKPDPQHGDIYMAWWDLGKTAKQSGQEDLKLFAFLVLPFFPRDSNRFGLSVTTSNLEKDIPTCYKHDPSTNTYEWAEDYKPGERKALKRSYPIMCFDGSLAPSVQWIPITHFRKFNAKDPYLEHKHIVNGYIASQRHIVHQPDFEPESDDTSSDSDSDSNSESDSDSSDDTHLPIAFRYTQTVNGRRCEIIYLDDDGTPKKVMEDPENYPLRWRTPELEVKKEPGIQDSVQRADQGTR